MVGDSCRVRPDSRVLGMGDTEMEGIAAMEGGMWRRPRSKPLHLILSERTAHTQDQEGKM